MGEIDGTSLRRLGTQTHQINANWKVVVDAFLEVYHVRTVHPDNAAFLYDDHSVTVTMLPKGHSRLTVPKFEMMIDIVAPSPDGDNPSVGSLWRETSTSFGIFPNVIAPMDTGAFAFLCAWPIDERTTELELAWWAPDWGDGDAPDEHVDAHDAVRDGDGSGHRQHGPDPGIDRVAGRPSRSRSAGTSGSSTTSTGPSTSPSARRTSPPN